MPDFTGDDELGANIQVFNFHPEGNTILADMDNTTCLLKVAVENTAVTVMPKEKI